MLRRSSAWRALGLGALSFSLFASPLPALHWEAVEGCYALTERHVSRAQRIVRMWHYPVAILDVRWIFDTDEFGVDTNESSEQDRRRAFRLLRPEVQEWLRRLGLVSGEGKRLSFPSFPHNTSINYVVYPAVRGRFEDQEYLWYHDVYAPGIAAAKLIPLSPGQITLVEAWDFGGAPDRARTRLLPNGFFLRDFPRADPKAGGTFWLRVDGAPEEDAFGFASLIVDAGGITHVTIAIFPPEGYAFDTLKDVEDLIKEFTNKNSSIWLSSNRDPFDPVKSEEDADVRADEHNSNNEEPPSQATQEHQLWRELAEKAREKPGNIRGRTDH